jgi:hypothetical protein
MARDVNVDLNLTAQDTSAIDFLEDLNARVNLTTKAIVAAQKAGGIRAIVADSEVKKVIALTKEVNDLTAEYEQLTTQLMELSSTDPGFAEMSQKAEILEGKIRDITKEIQKVPNKLGGSPQDAFDVGLPDTTLSAISGLSGGLGNQQLADLTGNASAILAVVDAAGKLAPALTNAPGIFGAVATQGAAMLAPLGATAAGFGAVLAVAAPIAVVLGVVAFAVSKFNESLEGSKKQLSNALVAQENYYAALDELTTEEVEAAVEKLEGSTDTLRKQREETANAIQATWDQAVAQFGEAGARALEAAGQLPLGDLRTRLGELDTQIDQNTQTTLRYNQGLASNAFAANDAAKAEEELAATRAAAIEDIAALQDQQLALQTAYDDQTLTQQQDRHIQETREQEDFWANRLRSNKANEDAIAKIEEAGQERLAAIHQQGVDKIAAIDSQISELGASLDKLGNDTRKAIDKINADFMRSEIESIQEQHETEAKLDKDYNKKRARLLQSLANDLLDAEAANDVVAFIARKRAGDEQVKQLAEDKSSEDEERQKAYEKERALAEEQRAQRIADAIAAADERRADIEEQRQEQLALRAETLAAIQQQKDAEAQRIQDTVDATQKAYDDRIKLEDDQRKIRLQREQDDYDLAEKRRADGLKKQMDEINAKIALEQKAAGVVGSAFVAMANDTGAAVVSAINRIRAAANSIGSGSSSAGGQGGASFSSGGGFGGGSANAGITGKPKIAFDAGGDIKRPTVALMGENLRPGEIESVFKWKPSEGMKHMADNSVSVQANITVVAGEDVEQKIERGLIAAARGIGRARRASG